MTERKLVLIADDDRDLASGIRFMLERAGYDVILAANGIEARRLIEERQPNLVILDMMMPRMGGYPVLESLQGKPNVPPIIMITANEGSRHKAYAEYLGVIEYLRKPFAFEQLLDIVTAVFTPGSGTEPNNHPTAENS